MGQMFVWHGNGNETCGSGKELDRPNFESYAIPNTGGSDKQINLSILHLLLIKQQQNTNVVYNIINK